jgi:polyisoprenoid-binding protein YceI
MALATDFATLTGDYTLDAAHSRIGFVARHAMVTKVRGAFNEFTGEAHIDGDDPTRSSVRVTIQAASIDTRNTDRDKHLRGNDFLALERYPEITFVSIAVGHAGGNRFEATGDLTIRGVTREITVPLTFEGIAKDPFGNTRVGFEGSTVVNRKDWGVNWNSALEAGGVLVGEKVTLEFEISAIKKV